MNEYNQFTDWRTPESERQKKSEASIRDAIEQQEIRRIIYDYAFGESARKKRRSLSLKHAFRIVRNGLWI